MRWVNIYEEYRNVLFDSIRVRHIYRRIGSTRFYICQFSLQSDIDCVGVGYARKFYLVKSYRANEKKPKRFNLKTGDIVRCYYTRSNKHNHYMLSKIVTRESREIIYPHPCYQEKPFQTPLLTLYE